MPWIEPEYLNCSVYLYPSEAEAEEGKRIGGSGFLISITLAQDHQHGGWVSQQMVCVVTNKHVADAGNKVVRVNTKSGGKDTIALDHAIWYDHSEADLTLCPIGLDVEHQFSCVSTDALITEKIISAFDIGPGDETFMVGRFVNHEGRQRNTPSLRFGNIAQMPFEPIKMNGLPPQDAFLVETRSIAGYSGSPVFVYLPPQPDLSKYPTVHAAVLKGEMKIPGINPKRMAFDVRLGPWVLGIDFCHIHDKEPVLSRITETPVSPEWYVKSNTGMAGVIPAWKIFEILNGDDMRKVVGTAIKIARERLRPSGGATLDVARDEPKSDQNGPNPDHKEDFMRLLGAAAKAKPSTDQT